MSRNVKKRVFRHVRTAKMKISLRMRADWSESSLNAFWIDMDAKFLRADNEYSDQSPQMRRLVWIFFLRSHQKVRFVRFRLL